MNIANRLNKLEARQPGAALAPKLVISFVCPERGITAHGGLMARPLTGRTAKPRRRSESVWRHSPQLSSPTLSTGVPQSMCLTTIFAFS